MTKRSALRRFSSRVPLRWRLALVSFSLFTFLLLAVGGIISSTEEQTLLSNQAIALREQVRFASLSQVLPVAPTPLPPSGPFPQGSAENEGESVAQDLVRLFSGPDIRATVMASDGTVLASGTTRPTAPPVVPLDQTAITHALRTAPQLSDYLLTRDSTGQRQLVVLLPIVLPPGKDVSLSTVLTQGTSIAMWHTVGALALTTSTAPIDRALGTTHLILFLGILGALVIAAALTLPLIHVALHPLTEMERLSTQIADGSLSLRLQVPPTHDEIGRLASAFNLMVARLETAFARQQQFVADASHELRTPITILSGHLEILLLGMDAGDRQAAHHLHQTMYAEVERMSRLVEDLLTLTRVDEQRLPLHLQPIDTAAFCTDLCEQARRLSREQTMVCEVAADVPPVRADRDRLRQVLLNVLENAFKYTPEGGNIRFIARHAAHGVVIEVQDTGIGIPPESLPLVFERFYRADPVRGRTSPQQGAGLGLAIARSLVEAQGGQMYIASEPGQGTTVTIQLPLA